MSPRKGQKYRLQVEQLEARDTPSALALPSDAGIIAAGAVNAVVITADEGGATVTSPGSGSVRKHIAGIKYEDITVNQPPQAQGTAKAAVCFNPVVVTPEGGVPTVTCADGGFVPPGISTILIS